VRNYNTLIGRYPGADGMKTGFICASGFNLVASATRNGKRIIAVVLGSPSSSVRALKAAQLMERGFSNGGLSWLTPSLGVVDNLVPINAEPPNLREEMCGPKRKRPAADSDDAEAEVTPNNGEGGGVSLYAGLRGPGTRWSDLIGPAPGVVDVAVVYTGPKRTGPALAAVTTEAPAKRKPKAAAQAKPKATAAVTPTAKPEAKPQAKPAATQAKPAAAAKPASAAKPAVAAKPAAADKPAAAAKPATAPKPATASVAKPAPKPAVAAAKPRPESKTDSTPKPN
jgi:D-alanyl-D-alanine carboxypeptidase